MFRPRPNGRRFSVDTDRDSKRNEENRDQVLGRMSRKGRKNKSPGRPETANGYDYMFIFGENRFLLMKTHK